MKAFMVCIALSLCFFAYSGEIADLFKQQKVKNIDAIEAELENIELGLERTECKGTCPAYSVIIKGDGSVKYFGEIHVSKIGKHLGTVSTYKIRRLLKYIKKINYSAFEDKYSQRMTDRSRVYTYFKSGNKTKVIENYANSAPATIWALEQMIDKLLLETKWHK